MGLTLEIVEAALAFYDERKGSWRRRGKEHEHDQVTIQKLRACYRELCSIHEVSPYPLSASGPSSSTLPEAYTRVLAPHEVITIMRCFNEALVIPKKNAAMDAHFEAFLICLSAAIDDGPCFPFNERAKKIIEKLKTQYTGLSTKTQALLPNESTSSAQAAPMEQNEMRARVRITQKICSVLNPEDFREMKWSGARWKFENYFNLPYEECEYLNHYLPSWNTEAGFRSITALFLRDSGRLEITFNQLFSCYTDSFLWKALGLYSQDLYFLRGLISSGSRTIFGLLGLMPQEQDKSLFLIPLAAHERNKEVAQLSGNNQKVTPETVAEIDDKFVSLCFNPVFRSFFFEVKERLFGESVQDQDLFNYCSKIRLEHGQASMDQLNSMNLLDAVRELLAGIAKGEDKISVFNQLITERLDNPLLHHLLHVIKEKQELNNVKIAVLEAEDPKLLERIVDEGIIPPSEYPLPMLVLDIMGSQDERYQQELEDTWRLAGRFFPLSEERGRPVLSKSRPIFN